jgi:hypothetical protein
VLLTTGVVVVFTGVVVLTTGVVVLTTGVVVLTTGVVVLTTGVVVVFTGIVVPTIGVVVFTTGVVVLATGVVVVLATGIVVVVVLAAGVVTRRLLKTWPTRTPRLPRLRSALVANGPAREPSRDATAEMLAAVLEAFTLLMPVEMTGGRADPALGRIAVKGPDKDRLLADGVARFAKNMLGVVKTFPTELAVTPGTKVVVLAPSPIRGVAFSSDRSSSPSPVGR